MAESWEMSLVPGLGAVDPMSVSVCACKTPASPMARSCNPKHSVPATWRKFGTQIMFANEVIYIIYSISTKSAIVSSNGICQTTARPLDEDLRNQYITKYAPLFERYPRTFQPPFPPLTNIVALHLKTLVYEYVQPLFPRTTPQARETPLPDFNSAADGQASVGGYARRLERCGHRVARFGRLGFVCQRLVGPVRGRRGYLERGGPVQFRQHQPYRRQHDDCLCDQPAKQRFIRLAEGRTHVPQRQHRQFGERVRRRHRWPRRQFPMAKHYWRANFFQSHRRG